MLRSLVLLPLIAVASAALAEPLTVAPERVSDGDTFRARFETGNTGPVRLAGCDTPERGQAFGKRATEALRSILSTGPVVVDCYKVDRYGRGVCRVNASGGDVCLSLIRAGMAWHYVAYAREQSPAQAEAYAQAQEAAQVARVGLWQNPAPVPPWEWRKAHSGPRKRPVEAPALDQ